MSASAEVEIRCDGPDSSGDRYNCPTPPVFDTTATRARHTARILGWKTGLPGGKDKCPDCTEGGQR